MSAYALVFYDTDDNDDDDDDDKGGDQELYRCIRNGG